MKDDRADAGRDTLNPFRETNFTGARDKRENYFFLFSQLQAELATIRVDPYSAQRDDH